MYPNYRLDTPPPSSRFRRPWSPDPNDPFPTVSRISPDELDDYFPGQYHIDRRQREPSDTSVEALDLADYAATLGRSNPYAQGAFRAHDSYPPSPPALRPLASPDSMHPPSLVSPSASSSSPSDSSSPIPIRRPYSLPPPSFPQRSLQSHPSLSGYAHGRYEPPVRIAGNDSEVDIAHFPSFTRAWYDGEKTQKPFSPPTSAYGPASSAPKLSPFDPTYPSHAFENDPYTRSPPPSYPSRSSRDLNTVPWNSADTDADMPVDPELKEERMRMLEAEFGGKQVQIVDEDEKVGSVDTKGKLITDGPKKRLAVRCMEVLLAITASVASIYSALIIKPATPPPPANKLPAYLLYVLSFLTVLSTTYLFLIHPCCCGSRKRNRDSPFAQGPGGLMVLPVQSLPGGGKKGKGGKRKNGKGGTGGGEGVQVNLIVDPTMFGGGERERDDGWDDEDGDTDAEHGAAGSYAPSSQGRGRRRAPRRRGIFAGLAMEEQWKWARRQLKIRMAFDLVAWLLWGVVFVVILLGKRCPVGGFDGWCDAYNLASAAACLLCVSFGFSIFFDIKDLHASKASPRTRP